MYRLLRRGALVAALVAAATPGCRRTSVSGAGAPTAAAPVASGTRAELLRRIATLAEVAPCLEQAVPGAALPLRIDFAEIAGEVATVTFTCTRAPITGHVTFFLVGGGWMVSTRKIGPTTTTAAAAPARDR
jgi:hypothetical protein